MQLEFELNGAWILISAYYISSKALLPHANKINLQRQLTKHLRDLIPICTLLLDINIFRISIQKACLKPQLPMLDLTDLYP